MSSTSSLYSTSNYCPASPSYMSITCYDTCCCYDSSQWPYCCDCGGFLTIYLILSIVGFIIFCVIVAIAIKKFITVRRINRQNLGYQPFGVSPVQQSGNIVYQPYNQNQPNYQYGTNPNTIPQQNNKYFQQQNKESIYMGEPVNDHQVHGQQVNARQ